MAKLFFSYHATPKTQAIAEAVSNGLQGWEVFNYKWTLGKTPGADWRDKLITELTSSQAAVQLLDPTCIGENYSDFLFQEATIIDAMSKNAPGFVFIPASTDIDINKDIPSRLASTLNITAKQFLVNENDIASFLEKLQGVIGLPYPKDPVLLTITKHVEERLEQYRQPGTIIKLLDKFSTVPNSFQFLHESLRCRTLATILIEDTEPHRFVPLLVRELDSLNKKLLLDILAMMAAARIPVEDLAALQNLEQAAAADKVVQLRHDRNFLIFWQMLRAICTDADAIDGFLPLMKIVRDVRMEGETGEWLDPAFAPNPIPQATVTLQSDRPQIAVAAAFPGEADQIRKCLVRNGVAGIIRRGCGSTLAYEGIPLRGPDIDQDRQQILERFHEMLKRSRLTCQHDGGPVHPGHFACCDI